MLHDLAAFRAQRSPRRRALLWRGEWLDYATLNARAERLAGRLRAEGLGPGDRVAVLAHNHLVHVDLLLAAPKLGVIYAPLNHRLSLAEQQALVARTEPALLFHDADHAGIAAALPPPRVALDSYEAWRGGPSRVAPPPALSAEDPWMLLCTGGSTGLPKVAVLPYRQVWANACATVLAWEVGAQDCVIQATPAFHAAVNVLATPLWFAGGAVIWPSQFDPAEWLRLAAAERVTLAFMVPTMFQMLAAEPGFAAADLSALRWAISGGAPCPPSVRAAFVARGIPFRQGYGMTEVGVNCFTVDPAVAEAQPDLVGLPMPGLRASLRRDDGQPCAEGEVGELWLSGAQVFSGYHGQPAETAASLVDGAFATGDLACRDADGHYRLCGRRKEMYISGGENVYPVEVEAALLRLPGVREAAVLGAPHPRWGECGHAFVVAEADAGWTPDSLRAALRVELAGYKLPASVQLLPALPRTGPGKIDKPALRRLLPMAEVAA